jgi:hypothetical protein
MAETDNRERRLGHAPFLLAEFWWLPHQTFGFPANPAVTLFFFFSKSLWYSSSVVRAL